MSLRLSVALACTVVLGTACGEGCGRSDEPRGLGAPRDASGAALEADGRAAATHEEHEERTGELAAFARRLSGLPEALPKSSYALLEEPCPPAVSGELVLLDVEAARSLVALARGRTAPGAWPDLAPAFAPALRAGSLAPRAGPSFGWLARARFAALLRPVAWRLPETLGDGAPLPGALHGWLFVVDLEAKAVVCQAAVDVEPSRSGADAADLATAIHEEARRALARVAPRARLRLR